MSRGTHLPILVSVLTEREIMMMTQKEIKSEQQPADAIQT